MTLSSESHTDHPLVGTGSFRYHADAQWARCPSGEAFHWVEASGVACDSRGRVFVFNRGRNEMQVYDSDGTFLESWGEGRFQHPHGVTVGPDDSIYTVDDYEHTVRKFTPEGRLLMTLGNPGIPSDTGATQVDYRGVVRGGPPFNLPTNVAIGHEGELYVSDGYGNARVHKFDPEGRLIRSWGKPGAAPGQFHLPHGIAVDRQGRVFVADRENSRIQIFSSDGDFLDSWDNLARPCQVRFDPAGNALVAELGYRCALWPGNPLPPPGSTGGRISILSPEGKVLSRWGGGLQPTAPGDFFAPHDIACDFRGDIYLTEVVYSAGGKRGEIPLDCHTLQKFTRCI